jgi:F-type H+-transporting ATPase subunit b
MDKFREEVMAKSAKQAEEELNNARRRIQEERDKAVNDVKTIAVDLAIDIAQKLIGEKLDDSKHRTLAQQFIEQLPQRKGPEVRG